MLQLTDQPQGRKAGRVSLCTPIPVGLPGQDSESGPWKQILLDHGEVQVGGSLGEVGRARPAVDGVRVRPGPREKEGRMGGGGGGRGRSLGRDQRPRKEAFREKTTSQVSDMDTAQDPHSPITSASSRGQDRVRPARESGRPCAFPIRITVH